MEDFTPVLWVLIAGAAMAYSAITNAKKQAQKGQNVPHQEAQPSQSMKTQQNRSATTPSHTSKPEPWSFDQEYEEENVSEIQSLETQEPLFARSDADSKRFTSLDGNMAAKQTSTPGKIKVVPTETTACTEEEAIADEFELRKAVIYSEILKPKFDE